MKDFKVGQKVTTKDSDSSEYINGIILEITLISVTIQWEDIKDPVKHYQDEFDDINVI